MSFLRLIFGITLAMALSVSATITQAAPGKSKRTAPAADGSQFIAQSNERDPSARHIVRTVANETLKTISTKEATSGGDEESPVLTSTKVEIEDAPGTRAPAEAVTELEPKSEVIQEAVPEVKPDLKSETHAREPQSKVEPKVSAPVASVSADQALSWLKNGNTRYVKNTVRKDGSKLADRQRLMKSEKPYAIVLSCSDSRVPPETVFDQALGEIYVIRTAGQVVDASVIASIEHAVQTMDPKLLVVMGHTSCSAVKTAMMTKEEDSAGSPALDKLVEAIRPRLPSSSQNRGVASAASAELEIESSANAQGAASDLIHKSEILRRLVESGNLVIKPALYHLDSGTVKFY